VRIEAAQRLARLSALAADVVRSPVGADGDEPRVAQLAVDRVQQQRSLGGTTERADMRRSCAA
jgi:hypothetical protein